MPSQMNRLQFLCPDELYNDLLKLKRVKFWDWSWSAMLVFLVEKAAENELEVIEHDEQGT